MIGQESTENRSVFYGLFSFLLLLVFIRYALQINIPELVFLGVAAIAAVFGNRNELVALCICCIPMYTAIPYVYIVFACIVIYGIKFTGDIKINLSIMPGICLFLWELLHCFNATFSLKRLIVFAVPYLLCMFLLCCTEYFDYGFQVRIFAMSTFAVGIMLLGKLLVAVNFNVRVAFLNMHRLGLDSEAIKENLTVAGGEINPNTLGILCVLALGGLFQLAMTRNERRSDMVLAICLLIIGALTMSKTFAACLMIMLLLFALVKKGDLAQKKRLFLLFLLVAVIAGIILMVVFPQVIGDFLYRFSKKDFTSGRADLFLKYNNFILERFDVLCFGVGVQSFREKLVTQYAVAANVPHNGFQEVLIAWGLPGILLFLWFVATLIWSGKRKAGEWSLLNFVPLLLLLAKVQAGQMITSPYTMLAFSFAYLSLCHCFESDYEVPDYQSGEL